MRFVRGILLLLIALIPLASLFHLDEYRHWETQHSAMAGPDEFSYLLMAQNFLRGGGLSLQSDLGLDTFYPPGYPWLIAQWTRIFWHGHLTAFAAHTLNTALLCMAVVVVYFFSRRVLLSFAQSGHRRFFYATHTVDWLALLIAALFATSWH